MEPGTLLKLLFPGPPGIKSIGHNLKDKSTAFLSHSLTTQFFSIFSLTLALPESKSCKHSSITSLSFPEVEEEIFSLLSHIFSILFLRSSTLGSLLVFIFYQLSIYNFEQ